MKYSLPELPKGQRWNLRPSILANTSELVLQEKRWWGWKKIDRAVISNDSLDQWITFHANNILKRSTAPVDYGIQEGTL